ncbi:MAG TPA: AAA family ATPase [Deltaproteobacteria bacterium]|nr:AAA family ATPase [Deltaproteobacteria bacterium]HOM28988.1 AAA family ATPase [Deltaproteobacteria bacterium]HPP79723.1 AAA family ATPase [Deltaproteobacteria bacterium]
MKIIKALDKVRRFRQASIASDGETPVMKVYGNAPVYSESRRVDPDMDTMEKNRCVCMRHDSPYLGAYKVLRTQIQKATVNHNWKSLMVTSALPGEGKTLTSINLALTFARAFDLTVLLVDCDLHRQDVHKFMGIESNNGLIDYLADGVPIKDLIIWPGIDKMTLISGGRAIKETTEFLTSPRMKTLVEEVKGRYQDRYVIFDTPAVLTGADAIAFASMVDCIIMVVEANRTPMKDVNRALELLPKEKFLGFVLNRDNTRIDNL